VTPEAGFGNSQSFLDLEVYVKQTILLILYALYFYVQSM
jgi:hypothetical protein